MLLLLLSSDVVGSTSTHCPVCWYYVQKYSFGVGNTRGCKWEVTGAGGCPEIGDDACWDWIVSFILFFWRFSWRIYLFILNFVFTLFYFTILYWFCHTLTWICQGCIRAPNPESPSHLPPHIISLDHPWAPAPSILYLVSNIHWHFVSYMIVYMFQCHSPKSSHPLPLPHSPKVRSTHLCLFCCLAYRVIITIFLNSIYMCQYTVLVFFFLAYFTLYNWLQFHPSH